MYCGTREFAFSWDTQEIKHVLGVHPEEADVDAGCLTMRPDGMIGQSTMSAHLEVWRHFSWGHSSQDGYDMLQQKMIITVSVANKDIYLAGFNYSFWVESETCTLPHFQSELQWRLCSLEIYWLLYLDEENMDNRGLPHLCLNCTYHYLSWLTGHMQGYSGLIQFFMSLGRDRNIFSKPVLISAPRTES